MTFFLEGLVKSFFRSTYIACDCIAKIVVMLAFLIFVLPFIIVLKIPINIFNHFKKKGMLSKITKPCPACRGYTADIISNKRGVSIICRNCSAKTQAGSFSAALDLWNSHDEKNFCITGVDIFSGDVQVIRGVKSCGCLDGRMDDMELIVEKDGEQRSIRVYCGCCDKKGVKGETIQDAIAGWNAMASGGF